MSTIKGYEGSVKAGSNTIGEVKNYSLEITADIVDTTTLGNNGWRENTPTLKGWSGSCQAYFDVTDSGQGDLRNKLRVGETVDLVFYIGANQAGNIKYSGSAVVKSVSITNDVSGLAEASFSFEGNGELSEEVIS